MPFPLPTYSRGGSKWINFSSIRVTSCADAVQICGNSVLSLKVWETEMVINKRWQNIWPQITVLDLVKEGICLLLIPKVDTMFLGLLGWHEGFVRIHLWFAPFPSYILEHLFPLAGSPLGWPFHLLHDKHRAVGFPLGPSSVCQGPFGPEPHPTWRSHVASLKLLRSCPPWWLLCVPRISWQPPSSDEPPLASGISSSSQCPRVPSSRQGSWDLCPKCPFISSTFKDEAPLPMAATREAEAKNLRGTTVWA